MITDAADKLIEALRYELQQYGEMLALLEKQQQNVLDSNTSGVLEDISAISVQTSVIQNARKATEQAKRELCVELGLDEKSSYSEVVKHLSEEYRILLNALIDENNSLIGRIHKRANQNHLLLKRSIEMIQQLVSAVVPGLCATFYNQSGSAFNSILPQTTSLYNEVG
ncbi:MAG: flagellar export chaperone FlgN [Verrucomicrobiia bacterium]